MSQAESIKELLGWLKIIFAAVVAVDVSLIAWLAQNFRSADAMLVLLAVIAVACITAGIVGAFHYLNWHAAFRRIAELEDL